MTPFSLKARRGSTKLHNCWKLSSNRPEITVSSSDINSDTLIYQNRSRSVLSHEHQRTNTTDTTSPLLYPFVRLMECDNKPTKPRSATTVHFSTSGLCPVARWAISGLNLCAVQSVVYLCILHLTPHEWRDKWVIDSHPRKASTFFLLGPCCMGLQVVSFGLIISRLLCSVAHLQRCDRDVYTQKKSRYCRVSICAVASE